MEKQPRLDYVKTKETREKEERKFEKDIDRVRDIMKNENPYEVTEDSEFFIIHYPHKNAHIPKRQHIPLVRENGLIKDVDIETFAHAISCFPEDELLEAVTKYEKEHPKNQS
ncbi:MAG: hypothetical protein WC099_00975 [Candidatus Paceibacterota bacterium]